MQPLALRARALRYVQVGAAKNAALSFTQATHLHTCPKPRWRDLACSSTLFASPHVYASGWRVMCQCHLYDVPKPGNTQYKLLHRYPSMQRSLIAADLEATRCQSKAPLPCSTGHVDRPLACRMEVSVLAPDEPGGVAQQKRSMHETTREKNKSSPLEGRHALDHTHTHTD